MPGGSNAVFLSYASEDADAAQRIATALRAAEIEVWFDREELRGGDAWDQKIRQQIHDCRLFVPIISAHTEARLEGYFRREWKLAVDRTESMASELAFLLPVVIDSTPNTSAHVPEKFRHVQWSRLADGEAPPAFIERVRRLLSDEASSPQAVTWVRRGSSPMPISSAPVAQPRWSNSRSWVIGAVLATALGYIGIDKLWNSRRSVSPAPAAVPVVQQTALGATAAPTAAFAPPPHSIAVLPFVNMSGDKDQEYFSDGLTEEILNSLARLSELQVTARTSSFSFKGKDVKIGTIGRELNVAAVLEGSVRRSGHMVRITTQLVDAATGFHLWSETYDRDLRDVLKLQTEIATAVATALRVSLLGDVASKSELGGTNNPAAFDAYLRGRKADGAGREDLLSALSAYTEAIRLDPGYALAFIARSWALNYYAANWATGAAVEEGLRKAETDARRALALAPNLADAHLALAYFYVSTLDLQRADAEYSRARALESGNASFLQSYGLFATQIGRTEAGLAAMRQAIRLDPVSAGPHEGYGYVLYLARRYEEAITAYDRGLNIKSDQTDNAQRGLAYYALGKLEAARASCAGDSEDVDTLVCLAVTYNKLGRSADAKSTLAKFMKLRGDADAYAYAEISTQWGETSSALEWLEKAARLRDTGLILLKTDPLMDPLRSEPRFQAIERALKFPD